MYEILHPTKLYSRKEVLSKPPPVPAERGLYAWYFKEVPPLVPTDRCIVKNGLTLLYVGISPKNETSKYNLRKRVTYHYNGNAEGSTLRQTLGVLLTQKSDFPLRRVGSGNRMTFTHLGELWLDEWMNDNAFVCWVTNHEPWKIEKQIIADVSLPLNIQDNKHHKFSPYLSELRKEAKKIARDMPIANEDNQQRNMANSQIETSIF